MGRDCVVHAGAVLGETPQDLAFKPVPSTVEIGDRCVIREGVTIHRGTAEGSVTRTGNDCYLMANSHLAHNVTLGNQVILANGVLLAGYVEVGDRAFLSGNAVVHQFVRIGRLAMLGGLSGISQDVPPFCTTESGVVNRLAGLNTVGLKRAGIPPETRTALKQAFRILFRSGLTRTTAVADLRSGPDLPPEVEEVLRFVEGSKRGVCSGRPATT
jgi:UDP-N-acetylglucosamine acyltransferase